MNYGADLTSEARDLDFKLNITIVDPSVGRRILHGQFDMHPRYRSMEKTTSATIVCPDAVVVSDGNVPSRLQTNNQDC